MKGNVGTMNTAVFNSNDPFKKWHTHTHTHTQKMHFSDCCIKPA